MRKFYASVNAIITHSKYVNEDVKLRLFESFSLPLSGACLTKNESLNTYI